MRYRFLRFPGGLPKAVTLSYDDGCKFDAQLADIIGKYGIKCTFNICSGFAGSGDWHLSFTQIKELLDRGHEAAVHGKLHRAPGAVSVVDGIRDVLDCRMELEREYGTIIRGMAYPDSGIRSYHNEASYENIKQYLSYLGIVYARSLGDDNNFFELPTDWHNWIPTAHHDNPQILKYIEQFVSYDDSKVYSASRTPKLFYMWGHSYEFDRNNNWEHLEKICEKLGNKADTWYATNIEIYDYIKAYNSLIFSADGTICYNPTLVKVWFDLDGKLYSIDSGETLFVED